MDLLCAIVYCDNVSTQYIKQENQHNYLYMSLQNIKKTKPTTKNPKGD